MATSLIRRNGPTLDPWRLLQETESRMWDWMATPFGLTPISRMMERGGAYVPPIDVYEGENEVFLVASLPGIDAATVDLSVHNGLVTIQGEQKPAFEDAERDNWRRHAAGIPEYGRFAFTVTLPCAVTTESAEAQYVDGLLRIRFQKPETARPVRIAVHTSNSNAEIKAAEQPAIDVKPKKR